MLSLTYDLGGLIFLGDGFLGTRSNLTGNEKGDSSFLGVFFPIELGAQESGTVVGLGN